MDECEIRVSWLAPDIQEGDLNLVTGYQLEVMTSDGMFAPYTACEYTENHADSTES